MPANGPVLLSESINIDQNGVVIEYGVTRFRGDRMELVLENEYFCLNRVLTGAMLPHSGDITA
jgi:hypothetical protein